MEDMMEKRPRYWISAVPEQDDFQDEIVDEFVDGQTIYGKWALMTPTSYRKVGIGRLGSGSGQRYKKQPDGKRLKVEG
jgi:hypothetical protein